MFNHSLQKSPYQTTRESGLTRHTIRTMLQKELNFRPWKHPLHAGRKPEECDRSSPELQEVQISLHMIFNLVELHKINGVQDKILHSGGLRHGVRRFLMIS